MRRDPTGVEHGTFAAGERDTSNRDHPRARIVLIGFIAPLKVSFGRATSNASTRARIGLPRRIALENGATNIRVNTIIPGFSRNDLIHVDALAATHGRPPVGSTGGSSPPTATS